MTATPYQPPSGVLPDTISAVVYASDDRGRTWYPHDGGLSAQSGYYGYAYSLAVDSSDAKQLYIGFGGAVMRSTDGGATWTTSWGNANNGTQAVWCLGVATGSTGRVWVGGGYLGLGALMWRSDDRGATWQKLVPSPYDGDEVLAVALDPLNDARLYAGMASGVRETEDAGATWRLALSPRFPGPIRALAIVGGDLVAVSDEVVPNSVPMINLLGIYRTHDHGLTWDTLTVPSSAPGGGAIAISSGIAFIGTRSGLWSVSLP